MNNLEPIETAVIEKLLQGNHPALVALRRQLSAIAVVSRKHTGVGFFTEFSVGGDAVAASVRSERIRFGDVEASIKGLQHGAGFLLYIDKGFLRMLEGYSYDEPWPVQISEFSLAYTNPARPTVDEEFD